MKFKALKHLVCIVVALFSALFSYSQENKVTKCLEQSDTLTIYFPLNKYIFDPLYMGNKDNLDKFDDLNNIQSIVCRVCSSPDGPLSRNAFLSKKRALSVTEYIHAHYEVSDSLVNISTEDEAWDELESLVRLSDMPWKDDVLDIFQNNPLTVKGEDGRIVEKREIALQQYKDGQVWEWMKNNWFPLLRQTMIIIKTSVEREIVLLPMVEVPTFTLEAPTSSNLTYTRSQIPAPWKRHLHLKTNFIGWAMGHANIAAEIDLVPHWSLAIPFYYSGGLDYFKSNIKFRGIVIQPEARYYFNNNDGLYVGAHLGLGWYNIALGGEYRIQDHKGRTPAYGGGLGLGYAMNFKKQPRCGIEFALGAGAYKAKYDVFYNEHNGPYESTGVEKVFIGVDNVSVSFTYSFNIKKGSRK